MHYTPTHSIHFNSFKYTTHYLPHIMSSDDKFVSTESNIAETNLNPEKEDAIAAESEATGEVSKRMSTLVSRLMTSLTKLEEVEGLKDSIGGGKVLDESEGYTRSSNKDQHAMQSEEELDKKIDALE